MTNEDQCPFCGGAMEAVNRTWTDGTGSWEMCHVDMVAAAKSECPVVTYEYHSEDEAVEKWNTRVGRTCHIKLKLSDSDFTSEPHWLCSECDGIVPVYEADGDVAVDHARYCPHCGAKVVEK